MTATRGVSPTAMQDAGGLDEGEDELTGAEKPKKGKAGGPGGPGGSGGLGGAGKAAGLPPTVVSLAFDKAGNISLTISAAPKGEARKMPGVGDMIEIPGQPPRRPATAQDIQSAYASYYGVPKEAVSIGKDGKPVVELPGGPSAALQQQHPGVSPRVLAVAAKAAERRQAEDRKREALERQAAQCDGSPGGSSASGIRDDGRGGSYSGTTGVPQPKAFSGNLQSPTAPVDAGTIASARSFTGISGVDDAEEAMAQIAKSAKNKLRQISQQLKAADSRIADLTGANKRNEAAKTARDSFIAKHAEGNEGKVADKIKDDPKLKEQWDKIDADFQKSNAGAADTAMELKQAEGDKDQLMLEMQIAMAEWSQATQAQTNIRSKNDKTIDSIVGNLR